MDLKNIELEKAIDIVKNSVKAIEDIELVDLRDALGRVLAEDIHAPISNPPFDRSPLDGFALRSEDTVGVDKDNPLTLEVVDIVYAGHTTDKVLAKNQCVRIMTGAKMPTGSDSVIRIEATREEGNYITIDESLKKYENYVFKGEDVEEGALMVEGGERLEFSHIGVLSSLGIARLKVYRQPKIGILGTGDELLRVGEALEDGKIYDSNGIMLGCRIRELGYQYSKIDIGKDDEEVVAKTILDRIDDFDLLITTGGVSVGDKDIFHKVVDLVNGDRLFWRVQIKPGTPVMYTLVSGKPLLSLSGNPFAALINFELLGRPIISKLSRDRSVEPIRTRAVVEGSFPKGSRKMRRFVRCHFFNGRVALPSGIHSSGALSTMIGCNAVIDMKVGMEALEEGDEVEIVLL